MNRLRFHLPVTKLLLVAACLSPWGFPLRAKAQPAKPAPGRVVSEEKTLVTKKEINLKMTYFPSSAGEEAPVVVLLHGRSGNRLVWRNVAAMLQKSDFAVVTLDLNGHGESDSLYPKSSGAGKKSSGYLKPIVYESMVLDDLESVKEFLFEEHQKKLLNMGKLAIAGADFSTAVAIAYADYDWQKPPHDDAPSLEACTPRGQDVKALVLLSPEERVPGLTTMKSVQRLKEFGVGALIGVGKNNEHDRTIAMRVYDHLVPKTLKDNTQYVYLQEYTGKLQGTDLLNQDDTQTFLKKMSEKPDDLKVEKDIEYFLDKYLKKLPIAWQDRRSRLERDDPDEK